MQEQTLVLIKPDAIGYSRQILEYFKREGFRKVGFSKHPSVTRAMVERHYKNAFAKIPEHRESIIAYLTSGEVMAYIFERKNAIAEARKLIGPLENAPQGTIRGDFPSDKLHSLVHASDSPESAREEIAIWFARKKAPAKRNEERSVMYAI